MSAAIDLNSDVGEGAGDDAAILAVVSSANVACGGHTGDTESMAETVTLALAHEVTIGAHIAYPDREGFGRRQIAIEPAALADSLAAQLAALAQIAGREGAVMRYVKPHGALYHRAAHDPAVAALVCEVVAAHGPSLPLLTLPGSEAIAAGARAGIATVLEGYADRAYTADGGLVSRDEPGAVVTDPDAVAARAVALATDGTVPGADGSSVHVDPRSLCIHGDTPGAAGLAVRIRDELRAAGVTIVAFAVTS